MPKPDPRGSTFAERAAAAAGESNFTAPKAEEPQEIHNSTFKERANIESKGSKPAKKATAKKTAKKA